MDKVEEKQGDVSNKVETQHINSEPKTSKLAILSLVIGTSSLFFFVFTGIPAIIIGIISHIRIRNSNGLLKGKYIAIAGMNVPILLMLIFLLFWSIDAPPIPNDYTIDDLRSAPAEYIESFDLLKNLAGLEGDVEKQFPITDSPAIKISEKDKNISYEIREILQKGQALEIALIFISHAKNIEQMWTKNEKAREIISRLYEYPEIADLTEPTSDIKHLSYFRLIELAYFYEIYAHTRKEENKIRNFTIELIKLNSIFRKLCLNARSLIGITACMACMSININSANTIANNPSTSTESLELLAEHFKQPTNQQLSMRNTLLFDYLYFQYFIIEDISKIRMGNSPLIKNNSTLRLYRNYIDSWINDLDNIEDTTNTDFSVWPNFYTFGKSVSIQNDEQLPFLYKFYNPIGSKLIYISEFSKYSGKRTASIIKHDLLQTVLNKRLGKEVNLQARAYSDEYIIDLEKKIILSPGPDSELETEDDIKLPINPEVLCFTK